MTREQPAGTLRRRIGAGLLVAYGVGIMVGAGIYVLTGAAAGAAGMWAPVAFLIAGLVAAPSALSFAELSARHPEAAGDSAYIEHGLGLHWLAVLVGLANVAAGIVAAAAILRGGAGYLSAVVAVPVPWGILTLGVALTAVAVVGVMESLAFAAILTAIEVTGLLLATGAGFAAAPVAQWSLPLPEPEWTGIAVAVVLAFFAFIGFDDMVNMAEEVKEPERVLPRAILVALAVTGVLYALVSLATVRSVPRDVLAASERPLALVWEAGTGTSAWFLSAIAVAAALNGVLAQIVMASRVLYGLGKRSPWLGGFRRTHSRFGTPTLATLLCGAAAIGASLSLPVATLAEITSQALLVVFAIVNASLIGAKRRQPSAPFRVPAAVPRFGLVACLMALAGSFVGG